MSNTYDMTAGNSKLDSDALKAIIRDIPDFPKKGIIFKDITPLLQNPEALRSAVDAMTAQLEGLDVQYVLGIESRGFIFSPSMAYKLGAGFIPVRKKGKLPGKTKEAAYALEYGEAIIEIHEDAIPKGARVAIVDDLLATGGTALAAARLVEELGGQVVNISFLIELTFLNGRDKLNGYNISSIIQY